MTHNDIRSTLKEGLVIGATILFVVLSLPLLAVFVLLARSVIAVGGAAVLVGGIMAYCASQRVRGGLRAVFEP